MSAKETLIDNEKVRIEKLALGPLGTNAYVIICQETNQSILVDAPAEAEKLLDSLKGTTPTYILLTHSHPDHTGALAKAKESLDIPLGIHEKEAASLPLVPELFLKEGKKIASGNLQLEVLHTPGHTPGSLSFRLDRYLFAGDTLFPGGPGKTFSPEGFRQILQSITQKLFQLSDDTLVFPGHGDPVELKKAKEEYRVFSSKEHPPDLYGDVVWLS